MLFAGDYKWSMLAIPCHDCGDDRAAFAVWLMQIAHQGHVPKHQRTFQCGLVVLRMPNSESHGRKWQYDAREVVADTGLSASMETVASWRAEPGEAYMLVPYTK